MNREPTVNRRSSTTSRYEYGNSVSSRVSNRDSGYGDIGKLRDINGHTASGNGSFKLPPAPGRGLNKQATGGMLGANLNEIIWDMSKLTVFEKDFYEESPIVKARSEEEVAQFREAHQIRVIGRDVPKPITTFAEAEVPDYLMKEISKHGFITPTPIQAQAMPMALTGRDMIGISATGSGKTLAFILPALIHINAQDLLKPGDGPIVLILAPTRELALQIQEECTDFGASSQIRNCVVYGGAARQPQVADLNKGAEIVIATPGRLIDLLENDITKLSRVTYLVLDEADRMLDMGFEPQINKIVNQIRPDRQTLMFSATWPEEVKNLARVYLKDPYQVFIGKNDVMACEDIEQNIEFVNSDRQKRVLLMNHLREAAASNSKMLIFTGKRNIAEDLTRALRRNGWPALSIHSDKTQQERDWAMKEFKAGNSPILIGTDIISRGLDIDNVNIVVNYTMPAQIEDYIHRIGRTGRAGKRGVAYAYYNEAEDSRLAKDLARVLSDAGQDVPERLLQPLRKGSGGFTRRNRGEELPANTDKGWSNVVETATSLVEDDSHLRGQPAVSAWSGGEWNSEFKTERAVKLTSDAPIVQGEW